MSVDSPTDIEPGPRALDKAVANRIVPPPAMALDPFSRFVDGEAELPFDIVSFWTWAASDLKQNVLRGWLAEYLVGRALGIEAKIREP